MKPRTKEEFDLWFTDQGDPWDSTSSWNESRLIASLEFIAKHLRQSAPYAFIEIGPFEGDFTRLLLERFPQSQIYGFEISEVAAERARARLSDHPSVPIIPRFISSSKI